MRENCQNPCALNEGRNFFNFKQFFCPAARWNAQKQTAKPIKTNWPIKTWPAMCIGEWGEKTCCASEVYYEHLPPLKTFRRGSLVSHSMEVHTHKCRHCAT